MSTDDVLVRLAESCTIRVPRGFTPASRRFGTPEGLQLHYLDWPGQGDTIVFLHGGALTAHTWDLVALELENDFHCVALDLRGHGLSDWSERYSIPDSVRDVAALADQLGGDGFHVVGMSLGGNVAAHYAASPGTRARSLVLVDVGPGVDFGATQGMREFMSLTRHSVVDPPRNTIVASGFSKRLDGRMYPRSSVRSRTVGESGLITRRSIGSSRSPCCMRSGSTRSGSSWRYGLVHARRRSPSQSARENRHDSARRRSRRPTGPAGYLGGRSRSRFGRERFLVAQLSRGDHENQAGAGEPPRP